MSGWELLSPAGSYESVLSASYFGADAVYMGGPLFQMRSGSVGMDIDTLKKSVQYLHCRNKKAYITVNTVLNERYLSMLLDYIDILKEISPDALIVSDIGALTMIRKKWPGANIILSTQANVMNSITANHYCDLGVSRIVLAREMSMEDIRSLRDHTDPRLSLEAFVHGSMCMAYSGRCLLSSFLLGRSANAGECAQPCRWEYRIEEQKRPGQFFSVIQENDYSMILSSKDLCMIKHMDDLKQAGITSFKIEGRMKTEYYTAAVTNAYRMVIDSLADSDACYHELEKVSHRPYTTGFYYNELPDGHYNSGEYIQEWTYCGKILSYENGLINLELRNRIEEGDILDLLSPGKIGQQIVVKKMYGSDGTSIHIANRPLSIISIESEIACAAGDMLRKKVI